MTSATERILAAVAHLLPVDERRLPAEFWDARPALRHIRTAAHSRLVAADAVLAAVLARVAACTPHTLDLPPIVGTATGLSLIAAIVGPPGAGKSTGNGVAADLLPAPAYVLDGLPIGSGEGLVEVMFGMVDETGPDGKTRQVKRQTRSNAMFCVDEGAVLADLGARAGSTLLPTLRTLFTHGTLGNANASAERRRVLPGHLYVYGITLAVQPELAAPLLADAAAGTPQRFLWLSAVDPDIDPHAVWPGELPWEPPNGLALDELGYHRRGYIRHLLDVAPPIATEIRAQRLAVVTGAAAIDALDEHRNLLRLKVGALLAILDGRLGLTEDDWDLADVIVRASDAVRADIQHVADRTADERERVATERIVRREARSEDAATYRALTSAARSVARIVDRHRSDHLDGCTRRCISQAVAGKHRALVTVEDVIAEAAERGWIRHIGERWIPGESRPA